MSNRPTFLGQLSNIYLQIIIFTHFLIFSVMSHWDTSCFCFSLDGRDINRDWCTIAHNQRTFRNSIIIIKSKCIKIIDIKECIISVVLINCLHLRPYISCIFSGIKTIEFLKLPFFFSNGQKYMLRQLVYSFEF